MEADTFMDCALKGKVSPADIDTVLATQYILDGFYRSAAGAAGNAWVGSADPYADSYESDPMEGHKLTYKQELGDDPAHSAVDHEPLDYRATSKWGHWSLVEHDWDVVHAIYEDVEGIYSLNGGDGTKSCRVQEEE